jgi:hypothetical protein
VANTLSRKWENMMLVSTQVTQVVEWKLFVQDQQRINTRSLGKTTGSFLLESNESR